MSPIAVNITRGPRGFQGLQGDPGPQGDPGDNAPTVHSGLTSLLADDHPQYGQCESGFDVTGYAVDDRVPSSIAFDKTTRTFTLAVQSPATSFVVWSGGVRLVISGPKTLVISNVEGLHTIYMDAAGDLQESVNAFSLDTIIIGTAFVANLYWNVTDQQAESFNDERHGRVMDSRTHAYLHSTRKTAWDSGLLLTPLSVEGSGNSAVDAECSVSDGVIWDEDIRFVIADGAPQDLAPVAQIPIFYQSGAGPVWRHVAPSNYLVAPTGSGRAAYNQFTGGAWQLTEVSNADFLLMHLFATTDVLSPVLWIMGQAVYASLALARAGADVELAALKLTAIGGLTHELKALASVIVQTSNSYANAVKSRVRATEIGSAFVDWRF